MPETINIRIKQFDDKIATSGVFMGGDKCRRKLEPGEIVQIPTALEDSDGNNIVDAVMATERVEITRDKPTRPLDYADEHEARYCSPNYRWRDPSDRLAMDKARAAVAERLLQTEVEQKKTQKAKKAERDSVPAAVSRREARKKRATRGGGDELQIPAA